MESEPTPDHAVLDIPVSEIPAEDDQLTAQPILPERRWREIIAASVASACIIAVVGISLLTPSRPLEHSLAVVATPHAIVQPTLTPRPTAIPTPLPTETPYQRATPHPHVVLTILCGLKQGSCSVPKATGIAACSGQSCGPTICRIDQQLVVQSGVSDSVGCSFLRLGQPRAEPLINACVLQQTVPYTNQTICYAFVTAERF